MKVYNDTKTQELTEYDLNLGQLKEDKIIHHIKAKPYIEEKGHYETIREYDNGGKDVKWVVDVKGQELVEEHNEEEDIYVYVPYTKEELLNIEKDKLRGLREPLLVAFDKYKTNVCYGLKEDTNRYAIKDWYKKILDLDEEAINNPPEEIKYYL